MWVKLLQVLQQLPSKETTVERVPMSFEQQDLYDELLAELANDVENESGKELKGASVMMSLRKAANHHLLHRRQFDDWKLKYMAELLIEVSCLIIVMTMMTMIENYNILFTRCN